MKEMKGRNDSMNGRIKITPKYLISLILIAVSVVLVYCLATMAWETAPMFEIQSKLDKYINYNVSGDQKGTLVQYTVRTGLLSEEKSTNQVEQEELNIELNQIDGKYPSDVKVLSKEDGDYNKEYNAENGLLTITTKDVKEFNVLCYYDTYTEGNEERALSFKVSAKIKVESEDEEINGDNLLETTVAENQGSLTSIDYVTGNIFNGKVKSNIINQTSFDTEYNEKMNVLIAKKEAQETIQITENNIYVKASQDENGEEQYTEIGNSQNLVYKSIKVGKQNLVDILGEEGTLQVLDSEGNVLAEINQETVYDENGYVTINYENEVSTIIIKTSEIKNEGLLKIENVKAIKASMTDIQNTKIKTTSEIKGLTQEFITDGEEAEIKVNENYKSSEENIVDIKDTKTDVKMEIDNTEWTNRQQNEVTFKINLNSNTVDKNLFKNPTLRIELPQEVEKVVLGNSSIMYGNGLQLVDPTAEKDENGKTVIVANLTGEQIQNNENALELSTEITIPATIILNKDLEVDGGDVKLTYTNNYTISGTPEVGDITTEVKFESYNQESLLQRKLTSTSPTATSNEESVKLEVTPVRGDVELADGDTVYEGEFIKYNVKATNTTGQDLQNVKVVATIPEGTTYAEYTSNFEQKRTPTKHEFNNELREKEITIGTLKAGESINKFYEVQVNDLNDNETEKQISTEIKIYSNNEEISKYNISNIVKPAEYKVYTYSFTDLEKDTYSIRVEVRGKSDENVNIKLKLPKEATPLYWADSDLEGKVEKDNRHEIDNLTSDKVLTITAAANRVYEVQVKIDETDLNKISEEYKFVATVNDTYVSNESRIEYKTEHVSINMTSSNEGEEVKNGDEIEYVINLLMDSKYITDSEDSAFTQINIKDCLPDEVIPVSITYPSNSVEVIEKKEIETDNEGNNQETKDYELKLVKGEEVTEELNDTVITDENGNVEPKVDFELAIPYNEPVTVKVKTIAGHVYEKTKVTNSATIEGVEEKASEAAIQNNDLEGAVQKRLAAETSNIVTHTILPYDYIDQSENGGNDADNNDNNTDNSGSQNGQTSFMVSGVVWNDQNEDGSQQSDEARIGDVETYLINAET
ncbi:MAG: DUF11 domain-containing protein, partial [Clostridia bacterium]|nr:DUF11 domain-containing protein [Clostridia bacterium]